MGEGSLRRAFVGRWSGSVKAGYEQEHRRFVDELRTPASAALLRKCSLTEYAIYERGRDLDVIFKSERPVIIAGFLRNKRLWPSFWEFARPGESDDPPDKSRVFQWVRDSPG